MDLKLKILTVLALAALYPGEADARHKSLGLSYSFSGIAAVYEYTVDSESFMELSLKAELADRFIDRNAPAGVSTSFTWNTVFGGFTSRDGNRVDFFAGPGAIIGWGSDLRSPQGLFFGLKGRVGLECSFARKVTIGVCLSPVVGSHVVILEDSISMKGYRNGLIFSMLPEVGIRYRF